MPTGKNTAKAIEFMQSFASGRFDLDACAGDGTFWNLTTGAMPFAEYAAFVEKFAAHRFDGPGHFEIQATTAEGNKVVVEAKGCQPLNGGGSYDNIYVWIFSFRDSNIVEIRAFFDTARAALSLRGSSDPL